jgi:hypothetical protein
MNELAAANEGEPFAKQIRPLQTIKGAVFLTAATIIREIGAFSAFKSPKQLFSCFGLDSDVKQSGNFTGTKIKMSKHGSTLARRAIHTIALVSIIKSKDGAPHNAVLAGVQICPGFARPQARIGDEFEPPSYWLTIKKNASRSLRWRRLARSYTKFAALFSLSFGMARSLSLSRPTNISATISLKRELSLDFF